jgi:hypothetical protein
VNVVPVTIGALAPTNDTGEGSAPLSAMRAVKLPRAHDGCSLPSGGRLVSCSSVEVTDLPGGTGQVGVVHQRRRIPLFGL